LALLIACFLLSPIYVNATTELTLQLDTSWRQDSNPLRFAENINVLAMLGTEKRGDSLVANDFRFALIHPLDSPETRLVLTGQIGQRNFQRLTQLNNTESAYKAALEWRFSELWRGALVHNQAQQLYNYDSGNLTTREMTHLMSDSAELALRISPDIEIPLALSARQFAYDSPANWGFDSDERSVDVGVRFLSTTNSNLRLGLRSTSVTSPKRTTAQEASLDSGYKDQMIYMESNWQYSALTRFSGRIASLQRTYPNLDAMNFSALTTEINVNHDYSVKTRLTLDLWNRPYGLTDPTVLYALGTGAQLGARWQASDKTRLSLLTSNEIQRYYASNLASGQSNAELNHRRLGGGIDYAVTREMRFYVDSFWDQLSRGTAGTDVAQNVFRIGIEYTYENMTGVAQRSGLSERR
jgi:hypothetical protein